MDITIRAARPEELGVVGELTAEVYLADGLLTHGEDDPYLAVLRDARRRAEHAELLVAVRPDGDGGADEVLGTVTFVGDGGEYADIARPGEGEFRTLAVRPGARGHGVGEALVRACVERAGALGLRRLVLSSQERMHAAHRLYERLGFVRTPERDWRPVPELTPLLTFALAMG
ncbi:GNAT family N-acetyltransferase [Streptomyces sp. TRM43335]|uniref:GNAT family N-acetyltransferase n=1 Tax=Streptomyces taklimakanensis TaxID=2569853 RepID=A0A6G2BF75_9ACTN|nr:GNAT family N-acetyltransferase [Streptomyces taklimakanensis]MTE20935.1 GNAT family N-acetyltransferase [Streptomyces taklimakanensis]